MKSLPETMSSAKSMLAPLLTHQRDITIVMPPAAGFSTDISTTNCGNRCRANGPGRCPLCGLHFYEEEAGTGSRFCGPWRKTTLQPRLQDRPVAQTRSRFVIRASSPSGRMADGAIAPARSVSISGSFCSFQYPAAGGSAHCLSFSHDLRKIQKSAGSQTP